MILRTHWFWIIVLKAWGMNHRASHNWNFILHRSGSECLFIHQLDVILSNRGCFFSFYSPSLFPPLSLVVLKGPGKEVQLLIWVWSGITGGGLDYWTQLDAHSNHKTARPVSLSRPPALFSSFLSLSPLLMSAQVDVTGTPFKVTVTAFPSLSP